MLYFDISLKLCSLLKDKKWKQMICVTGSETKNKLENYWKSKEKKNNTYLIIIVYVFEIDFVKIDRSKSKYYSV